MNVIKKMFFIAACFVFCMPCSVVMVNPLYPLLIRLYDDSRDNRVSDRSQTTAFDRKVERYDRREDRAVESRDTRSDRSFGDRRDRDSFSRDGRQDRRSNERFERWVTGNVESIVLLQLYVKKLAVWLRADLLLHSTHNVTPLEGHIWLTNASNVLSKGHNLFQPFAKWVVQVVISKSSACSYTVKNILWPIIFYLLYRLVDSIFIPMWPLMKSRHTQVNLIEWKWGIIW